MSIEKLGKILGLKRPEEWSNRKPNNDGKSEVTAWDEAKGI